MTNKEWLATVDSQKWYSVVHCWLFHEYGKRFDNTSTFLGSQHLLVFSEHPHAVSEGTPQKVCPQAIPDVTLIRIFVDIT